MVKKKRQRRKILKDPKLRRLRLNLRLVLMNAYHDYYSYLKILLWDAEGDELRDIQRNRLIFCDHLCLQKDYNEVSLGFYIYF